MNRKGKKEEATREFITEYELLEVIDHKSILMWNFNSMEVFETKNLLPQMKKWNREKTALMLSTLSKNHLVLKGFMTSEGITPTSSQ